MALSHRGGAAPSTLSDRRSAPFPQQHQQVEDAGEVVPSPEQRKDDDPRAVRRAIRGMPVSARCDARDRRVGASHPLDERLEPRVLAYRVEIRVVLAPTPLTHPAVDGLLEKIDGPVGLAQQGVGARRVVEHL